MAYQTVFHLISDIINKSGISCILIGGSAVNYYKVTRMTADVDFLIVKEDFEKILKLLEKANYKVDFSDKVFVRLTTNIRSNLMDIDFMFVDNETLNKIIKDGQKVRIANQEFIVPSLNNLIALKIHSLKYNFKYRENKDLPDIVDLIRINKIDCRMEEFRKLCLKYGTEPNLSKNIKKSISLAMKDLNLPVIKKFLPEAKRLSMDDYLKFVYLHLKYTYNRRAYKKWKKMLMVNVPFFIKE